MRSLRRIAVLLVLVLLTSAAAIAPSPAAAAPEAAPAPGTARVWFLRTAAWGGISIGASPMIYADGQPVGALGESSAFYRDFPPGTHRFAVDPYGLPTGDVRTVELQPGTTTYLQVSRLSTWEMGYPTGVGIMAYSFFIVPMSPHSAVAYLQTLTNLGAR
jgi:hypothetical protein